jgi:hypothetical protein
VSADYQFETECTAHPRGKKRSHLEIRSTDTFWSRCGTVNSKNIPLYGNFIGYERKNFLLVRATIFFSRCLNNTNFNVLTKCGSICNGVTSTGRGRQIRLVNYTHVVREQSTGNRRSGRLPWSDGDRRRVGGTLILIAPAAAAAYRARGAAAAVVFSASGSARGKRDAMRDRRRFFNSFSGDLEFRRSALHEKPDGLRRGIRTTHVTALVIGRVSI